MTNSRYLLRRKDIPSIFICLLSRSLLNWWPAPRMATYTRARAERNSAMIIIVIEDFSTSPSKQVRHQDLLGADRIAPFTVCRVYGRDHLLVVRLKYGRNSFLYSTSTINCRCMPESWRFPPEGLILGSWSNGMPQ